MSKDNGIDRRKFVIGGGLAVAGSLAPWIRTAHAQAKAEHTMIFAPSFTQATEKYVVTGIDLFKQLAEKYGGGRLPLDGHQGGKLGGHKTPPQKKRAGAHNARQK